MAFNGMQIVLGDILGGIIGCAVSGLGVFAYFFYITKPLSATQNIKKCCRSNVLVVRCQPGKYPFLPTFVVCSFVNGTVPFLAQKH